MVGGLGGPMVGGRGGPMVGGLGGPVLGGLGGPMLGGRGGPNFAAGLPVPASGMSFLPASSSMVCACEHQGTKCCRWSEQLDERCLALLRPCAMGVAPPSLHAA
jgi:hypothetical protein